ncbi:hypothetical protein CREGCYN_16700 (plasmid) [Synechococcus sp. M16CYN]
MRDASAQTNRCGSRTLSSRHFRYVRFPLSQTVQPISDRFYIFNWHQASTEVHNWDVIAKGLKAAGNIFSQMYIHAKALAQGKLNPMPTS